MSASNDIVGVIVAGGRGRRLGGADKALVELGGQSLLARVIARIDPQVSRLILSANGDPGRFDSFGLPVVADSIPDFGGPLAGLLAAMDWVRLHEPAARWIVSTSVDTPFLPHNLVAQLRAAQEANQAELVCAWSNGQIHPVTGLWSIQLADDLRRALIDEDLHKVDAWAGRHRMVTVDFPTDPIDPFFNINRPEDLAKAEALLASRNGKPV